MYLLRLAPALLLLTASPSFSQDNQKLNTQQGRVSGIVLTEDGQAMAGVSVCTTVIRKDGGTTECRTTTDNNGRFDIDHLGLGSFGLQASQEGYVMSDHPSQSVKLTTEQPSANVIVRLGKKGAILSVTVRDKFSGKAVPRFTVFTVSDDERESASGGGENGSFRLTLRSGVGFILAVTGKGYKSAFYPDTLNLQSGEEKSIDIELEPKPQD
jgi:hypothetical protein